MIKPPAYAVWAPEQSGSDGLKSAVDYRERFGGWVFVSTTQPGYVAWFDLSHTPSMVLRHTLTQGHNGVLNPLPEPPLRPFRVSLHENEGDESVLRFECQAEDGMHAMEQAENAYPSGKVLGAVEVEMPGPKDLATQLAEAWNIAAGTAQESRVQARWDAAHERAYALSMPAVNAAQERFEAGESEIEEFEQAITAAEQQLALA